MCGTCGCSDGKEVKISNLRTGKHVHMRRAAPSPDAEGAEGTHEHSHEHHHDHGHGQAHHHDHGDPAHIHAAAHGATVALEQAILRKNDELAARNRAWLREREILALNLVSSPGSGKTSLLERTIRELGERMAFTVIEGDQQTVNDARRIEAAGAPAVQINTGAGCHLEADMVMGGLQQLKPPRRSVIMIENVGNLVCPALFDLGEAAKVAILSVTEGDDKPGKYPHMFNASELMIINKIDLLPYVDFDLERCVAHAREVNPDIEVVQLSARTGDGLGGWYNWLERRRAALNVAVAD